MARVVLGRGVGGRGARGGGAAGAGTGAVGGLCQNDHGETCRDTSWSEMTGSDDEQSF